MKLFIFIIQLIQLGLVWGLEPVEIYKEEGSCADFPVQQVQPIAREVWDSFHFLPAGSKWIFHILALPLPNYREIRTDELYYDFCPTRNTSTVNTLSVATLSGFGGPLVNYEVRVRTDVSIYIETRDFLDYDNNIFDIVTLTDYKNFAFLTNCFMGSQERSWVLLSRTPEVHPDVIRLVQRHAKKLGFRQDNFVFLRYDSCRSGIVLDNIQSNIYGEPTHEPTHGYPGDFFSYNQPYSYTDFLRNGISHKRK